MKFRSGVKRAEMANAIDQYVSDTIGEVSEVFVFFCFLLILMSYIKIIWEDFNFWEFKHKFIHLFWLTQTWMFNCNSELLLFYFLVCKFVLVWQI